MGYTPSRRIFTKEEIAILSQMFYTGQNLEDIRSKLKCGKQVLNRFLKENNYIRYKENGMQKHKDKFISQMENINPNIEILGEYRNCKSKILARCKIDGFEWDVTPDNLIQGRGCPICSNKRTAKGFNDIWTTNPEVAKLLNDPEDGYKYSVHTNKKLDFRCPYCGEVATTYPDTVLKSGNRVLCPICSNNKSFPERFMYCLLKQLNIEFQYQHNPDWINRRRYDFYLTKENVIIETNGAQHYSENGFCNLGGRTLEEEKANDRDKREIALCNGIFDVIFLDCSVSTVEYIKNSIINNKAACQYLDIAKVDFFSLERDIYKPMVIEICNEWEFGKGKISKKSIAQKYQIAPATVAKYISIGIAHGWCKEYGVNKRNTAKMVYELNMNYNIISIWDSIYSAINHYGYTKTCSLRSYLSGARGNGSHKYKGRLWYYEDDYKSLVSQLTKEDI